MVVAFKNAPAVAAARVTHDETELVPALPDADVRVSLLA